MQFNIIFKTIFEYIHNDNDNDNDNDNEIIYLDI